MQWVKQQYSLKKRDTANIVDKVASIDILVEDSLASTFLLASINTQ